MTEVLHAWFSLKASARHGHSIYKDADGKDVYATNITTSDKLDKEKYRWDDVEYRGIVIECVQHNIKAPKFSPREYAAKRGRETFGWYWS